MPNIHSVLYSIENDLIDQELLFAHIDDENKKEPEKLIEHLNRAIYSFKQLSEKRGIEKVIDKIINNLMVNEEKITDMQAEYIKELFINAIYLHDIGKINPAFQYVKMKNKMVEFANTSETSDSNHSIISALIFIDIYIDKINELSSKKEKRFLKYVLLIFAYIISRHHTYLTDFGDEDFLKDLRNLQERFRKVPSYLRYYKNCNRLLTLELDLFNNIDNDSHEQFQFYILTKLLYSSIVSCDFYATNIYDTGKNIEFRDIDDIDRIFNIYKSTGIYKGIDEYKNNKNFFEDNLINRLRSDMFIEAENNLLDNLDKCDIFYLEAPTGGGKTNTSINLALNIIKRMPTFNKITYIFPFNTLIEQTKKTFDKIFDDEIQKKFRVAVINSIVPIVTEKENNLEEDEKHDFKKDYLNRQMLQYPITLTTHVNFFNYLFGTGREINLPLIHLCNSIIIIDEVQSYRNRIWPEIIRILNAYSKLLNIKIIIMSATLPKLDKLLPNEDVKICDLISDKNKYYQNPLFKNRVKLNYDLLKKDRTDKEELLNKIDEVIKSRKNIRLIIEFIKKSTAREFFDILKEKYPDRKIYEITGDDSNYIRNKILNEISKKDSKDNFECKDVILVATQVIEAGVDIDMDIGFKDISLLDGEEQFLGRINRSCKKDDSKAYFFNYDKAEQIYREDFRLEIDLRNEEYQGYLLNKNFEGFYELCFKRLNDRKNQNTRGSLEDFNNCVLSLNYQEVNRWMRLIIEDNYQLYLAHKIENKETREIIDGKSVWWQYKDLIADTALEYSEKKIKLSILSEKMAYFTFNFKDFQSKYDGRPKIFNESVGRLYYIENGEEYMTSDGKFDRKKYTDDSGGIFI